MSIQKETNLEVADNSGAKKMRVISIVGSTGKKYAKLGDLVKCAVKEAIPGGVVKKKAVVEAVIVRTKKPQKREDGSYISFGENAAVILEKKAEKSEERLPIATRIFGPVARELRAGGFTKIVSLAQEVL
jgi:large subunit ribosomal protein L14